MSQAGRVAGLVLRAGGASFLRRVMGPFAPLRRGALALSSALVLALPLPALSQASGGAAPGQAPLTVQADSSGAIIPMKPDAPAEALPLVFEMLEDEGICLGGSSGINIAGAIRMAKDMGPGKTIVTILCDYGNRYQSKLYNPAFLKEKGLPVPEWLDRAPKGLPTVFEDA